MSPPLGEGGHASEYLTFRGQPYSPTDAPLDFQILMTVVAVLQNIANCNLFYTFVFDFCVLTNSRHTLANIIKSVSYNSDWQADKGSSLMSTCTQVSALNANNKKGKRKYLLLMIAPSLVQLPLWQQNITAVAGADAQKVTPWLSDRSKEQDWLEEKVMKSMARNKHSPLTISESCGIWLLLTPPSGVHIRVQAHYQVYELHQPTMLWFSNQATDALWHKTHVWLSMRMYQQSCYL